MIRFVKSRAVWQGTKGVSLTRGVRSPLVHDAGDPTGWAVNCYSPAFGTYFAPSDLAAIRGLGVDYVRIAFAPAPLCATKQLGQTARYQGYLTYLANVVSACLVADLRVVVDMHFGLTSTEAPWRGDIMLASASNQYLTTFTGVLTDVAALIRQSWTADKVALEIFNEPEGALWSATIQPALFAAVRAVMPGHTIIVSGSNLGSIGIEGSGGLVDGTVNPADYDGNTLYSFHWYDSYLLTNCGNAAQATNAKYVSQIPFPAVPGDEVALLAAATTKINADGTLSAGQKTAAIAQMSSDLLNYTTNKKSGTVAWVQARIQQAIDWAAANGIERSRLIMGEMGAVTGTDAAPLTARANWAAVCRSLCELHGVRWGWWDYTLDPSDTISLVENGAVQPAMKAALGLT